MTNFSYNLGETLRYFRKKKKLTQSVVAELANIDCKHYSRIERNYCDTKVNTLVNICLALDIKPEEFFKSM